ncbi:DUF4224 domain-containing protein [Candidimonas sp. SYP-B2681]|uniref:DUF4224 domain-containing protein n=1 Tax=Candidimonas sp. SYP-B2681 TaxID=2497686 RepID=UPI000F89C171|nr:DUF4224 domain-containing protein [Candidimonas sp. SYP-B2681]
MISPITSPILSDEEIRIICDPLQQPIAQIRFLRSLGLLVNRKPNGRALVARSEFERVLGAQRFAPDDSARIGPNLEAIRERWANKKRPAHTINGKSLQKE